MSKKKKILLACLLIVILLVVQVVAYAFYLDYSKLYFHYEGDMFVESIGGPYWIPLTIMLIAGVMIIVTIIFIIVTALRKKK